MSVRDYALNYLPDGSRRPAAATGRGAVGSDASSGSTPGLGTHALDGPEHTPATGTDLLLATIDRAGLMPPLSGNPADVCRGDGTVGPLSFVELVDVDVASPTDGYLVAWDAGTSRYVLVAPPSGSVPSGTAPGDILAWDGAAWAVLPVGTDGQVLYADSGETVGLLWDDAPAGGGGGDPVADLFGTPDTAHEFSSSSLSGWTALGSPTVSDADTTVAGCYYLQDSTGGIAIVGIHENAPSTPFTAITYMHASIPANYNSAGILLGSSDPSGSRSALFQLGHDSGGATSVSLGAAKFNSSSSFDASLGVVYNYFIGDIYVAIVANSDTSVDQYWSLDGRVWHKSGSAINPNLTIAKLGLAGYSAGGGLMRTAFEYLRLWNGALTFPGF